jgi:membrane-bound lytic murein transglycosylase B
MKYITQCILFTLLLTIQFHLTRSAYANTYPPLFKGLVKRLHEDGIDERYLSELFSRPDLKLVPGAVTKSLIRKEANLNYAQFLEKYSVDKAVTYLKTYKRPLKETERHFGVSAPIVVAILSVETACGTYIGRFKAVNLLVTQALSLEPEVYRKIYGQIPAKEKERLAQKRIKKRLRQKSIKGYRELKALLNYARSHDIDPFTIQGSSEGAIGIPQFLPSNIKVYGYDGNGDGRIDLFQHEDAIASVASFLKAFRWNKGNSYQKKKEIIRRYNPSDYYADTVLKLAEILKDSEG